MNLMSLYGETNAMGVVLGEKDEEELQRLASTIMSSKMSGKSKYASRLQYIDEDGGSQSGMVLEALLS